MFSSTISASSTMTPLTSTIANSEMPFTETPIASMKTTASR